MTSLSVNKWYIAIYFDFSVCGKSLLKEVMKMKVKILMLTSKNVLFPIKGSQFTV